MTLVNSVWIWAGFVSSSDDVLSQAQQVLLRFRIQNENTPNLGTERGYIIINPTVIYRGLNLSRYIHPTKCLASRLRVSRLLLGPNIRPTMKIQAKIDVSNSSTRCISDVFEWPLPYSHGNASDCPFRFRHCIICWTLKVSLSGEVFCLSTL